MNLPFYPTYMKPISPQSSLESIDHNNINDGMSMQDIQRRKDFHIQAIEKNHTTTMTWGSCKNWH